MSSPCFFTYTGVYSTDVLFFRTLSKMFKTLNFEPYEIVSIRNKMYRRKYFIDQKGKRIIGYKASIYDNDFHRIERIFFEGEKNVIYQNK